LITPGSDNPRQWRPKLGLAMLAAAFALAAGTQALSPAVAGAMDGLDETCIEQQDWWHIFEVGAICANDGGGGTPSGGGTADTCSAPGVPAGEAICIKGEAPYAPGGRPLGSRPSPSTGGDGGRPEPGGRGGRPSPSMSSPAKSPKELKETVERCEKIYDDLKTLRQKQRLARPGKEVEEMVYIRKHDVARGTMGFWKSVTLSPDEVKHRLQRLEKQAKEENCARWAPTAVY
jgi:hypothetical protein